MFKKITIFLILLLSIPISSVANKNISLIEEIASKEGVNKNICLSIAKIESDFNSKAYNNNSYHFTKTHRVSKEKYISRGEMQLTFDTGRKFNKEIKTIGDLYIPRKNIIAGVRYIKYLINKYPNLTYADISQIYNLGETAYFKGKRNKDYENKFLKWFFYFSNHRK